MIFQVFQLSFGIVRIFSWRLGLFGFSVGLWDGSGFQLAFVIFQVFQLAFEIVRVFSWLLGMFGFSVGLWDGSGFSWFL